MESQEHLENRLLELYFSENFQQSIFSIIEGKKNRTELIIKSL